MSNLIQVQSDREVSLVIKEIVETINNGETIVFCGAGISRDSGLPIVNQLVPYILDKFEFPKKYRKLLLDKNNNPIIPFEAFIEVIEKRSDYEMLVDIYAKGDPNTNHIFLSHLIKLGKLLTVVTTNFDNLIEKALTSGPNPLFEGKDFEVIYNENDFDSIDWTLKKVRIIKIHGSVKDKETIAITLKHVSNQVLSNQRKSIIDYVFSKGSHKSVIILGYSSSDTFDLSIHINNIKKNQKKVYYIQHDINPKVELINHKKDKNPFRRYKGSIRLYIDTNFLIKSIWVIIIEENQKYKLINSKTKWFETVDIWYNKLKSFYRESVNFTIPAFALIKTGNYNYAINFFEVALKLAHENNDKEVEGSLYGDLANAYRELKLFNKAIEYYNIAIQRMKEFNHIGSEGIWLSGLANTYFSLGEYKKSMKYHKESLKIAVKINDSENQGEQFGYIANTYIMFSKFNLALKYYAKSLKIANELGNKEQEGIIYNNLGLAYDKMGLKNKSIYNLEKSLRIGQEIGNKSLIKSTVSNLSIAYMETKEYKQSIKSFRTYLKLADKKRDTHEIGLILCDLGDIYLQLRRFDLSMINYLKALKIAQKLDDKILWELTCGRVGGFYFSKKEYEKAIDNYLYALFFAEEAKDKKGEAIWLINIGLSLYWAKEYEKAYNYFNQALEKSKSFFGLEHPNTEFCKNKLIEINSVLKITS